MFSGVVGFPLKYKPVVFECIFSQNDLRVAYRLPWRLTEVPFLKFDLIPGWSSTI